jgi:hypothetical protein
VLKSWEAFRTVLPKSAVQNMRKDLKPAHFCFGVPRRVYDVFSLRFGRGGAKGSANERRCEPELAVPGFGAVKLFDVNQLVGDNVEPRFFLHLTDRRGPKVFSALNAAAKCDPKVVPAFASVSHKKQAAFVFNEGTGRDAVTQGVCHC